MKQTNRPGARLWLASVFVSTLVTASAAEFDRAAMAARLGKAVVRVKYELQFDQADAPAGGLGRERCPNCGNFHATDLQSYLTEERPVETAGYLLAADRVVSIDPLIHPRFLKSVTVQFRDQVVAATISSVAQTQRGVILQLAEPLRDAAPLEFAAQRAEPAWLASYAPESGEWVISLHPFPRNLTVPDSGQPFYMTSAKGIALGAGGDVLGIVVANRLAAGGDWQGSPAKWPAYALDDVLNRLGRLAVDTAVTLPRVELRFRSPRAEEGEDGMRSSRYSDDDGRIGDDATEASVPGMLLGDGRVVVLASLKSKLTARLESIEVWLGDQSRTATFESSLREYGAFTARLEGSAPAAVKVYDGALPALLERLLLQADLKIQGETRNAQFSVGRITSCKVGPLGRLHPQIDAAEVESTFLFGDDGRLIALPLARRSSLAGRNRYWSGEDLELTPVNYLLAAVAGLPATADPSNAPVSAEDESRLAWLGVELQPMNQQLARANNVVTETRDGEMGALVSYVYPGSPADQAGIRTGSVLLRLQVPGQPLPVEVQLEEDLTAGRAFPWDRLDQVPEQYFDRIPAPWPKVENEFVRKLTDLGFGTGFTAEWVAAGEPRTAKFEVVAGPVHYGGAPRVTSARLGVTVRGLTYDVRRYLQLAETDPGVVVSKIEAGSRTSVAGVKPYELITHVNEQPVTDVSAFEKLTAGEGELSLTVKRMNKSRLVTLK